MDSVGDATRALRVTANTIGSVGFNGSECGIPAVSPIQKCPVTMTTT